MRYVKYGRHYIKVDKWRGKRPCNIYLRNEFRTMLQYKIVKENVTKTELFFNWKNKAEQNKATSGKLS